MARKCYSIKEKLSMICAVEVRCRNNNEKVHAIAREFGVDHAQILRWKAQAERLEELLGRARANASATSIHPGRKSCLEDIEEELLGFIWEQREQGLAVSIRAVCMKASQLDAGF